MYPLDGNFKIEAVLLPPQFITIYNKIYIGD